MAPGPLGEPAWPGVGMAPSPQLVSWAPLACPEAGSLEMVGMVEESVSTASPGMMASGQQTSHVQPGLQSQCCRDTAGCVAFSELAREGTWHRFVLWGQR